MNGTEVELQAEGFEVARLGERLIVRSPEGSHTGLAVRAGDVTWVSYRGRQFEVRRPSSACESEKRTHSGEIHAPMPGSIVEVRAVEGQAVERGDKLVILEAMKTQQSFEAPFAGTVTSLPVSAGDQVVEGQLLALVEPRPA
ncbi:MAG: biotin/lipoyl-containing protein [Fimbriimonadaceae bacterium]|nr:MAG: Glutaconyl-CoA decarboxylase subunit gamma [Armatimonadetes bacterium OLB18]WKZ81474.1 MAG: biotin/lipoyl-containing protein [Fimbriimonadaceae bacterium]